MAICSLLPPTWSFIDFFSPPNCSPPSSLRVRPSVRPSRPLPRHGPCGGASSQSRQFEFLILSSSRLPCTSMSCVTCFIFLGRQVPSRTEVFVFLENRTSLHPHPSRRNILCICLCAAALASFHLQEKAVENLTCFNS